MDHPLNRIKQAMLRREVVLKISQLLEIHHRSLDCTSFVLSLCCDCSGDDPAGGVFKVISEVK